MTRKKKVPTCSSCSVPWADHDGIILTCRKLAEALAEVERLQAQNRTHREFEALAVRAFAAGGILPLNIVETCRERLRINS